MELKPIKERVDAMNQELPLLLKKHSLLIRPRPIITADGRITVELDLMDNPEKSGAEEKVIEA
jgi:hypothetical protein